MNDSTSPHDLPQWRVWLYFGQDKFVSATQNLEYLRTADGLHHYRDRRDGGYYSVPVEGTVREHFKEKRLSDVYNMASWKNWKLAWGLWGATLVALFLATWICYPANDAAVRAQNDAIGNTLFVTMLIVFIVGIVVLPTGRAMTKAQPTPLPRHTMFLTDAEIDAIRRREQQKQALAGVLLVAYAAHKYHEHSQEHLADLIAEREHHGRGLNGSEWHQ